jgi:hypothetical protein
MPCILSYVSFNNTEVHNPAGYAIRQKQKALWFHGVVLPVQYASHKMLGF